MLNQKIILIFLLLNFISYSQSLLREENEKYVSFELGSKVQFNKVQRFFKFDYSGENDKTALFFFKTNAILFYLVDENKNRIKIDYERLEYNYYIYQVNLTYDGTYYIELETQSGSIMEIGSVFESYIPGKVKEIDLSDSYYYNDLDFYTNKDYGYYEYKVKNLTEAKYVFFKALISYYNSYAPYYGNDTFPICSRYSQYIDGNYYYECDNYPIFEVCNGKTGNCTKFVQFYKFENGTEYTITVHFLKNYETYYYFPDEPKYRYVKYILLPLSNNDLENIDGETGIYPCDKPKIYQINANANKDIYGFKDYIEFQYFNISKTKINNIEGLFELNFQEKSSHFLKLFKNETRYYVAILFSPNFKGKLYLLDEMDEEFNQTSFEILKDKNRLVERFEEEEIIKGYMYTSVITSDHKNMKYAISDNDEKTDLIIQNYGQFPIYFDKTEDGSKINIKYYSPKYAFFGATNPYFFDTIYSYLTKTASMEGIDINSYLKVTQMNLRINTKYLPWFEFYNFYVQKLNLKVNVYIKQLFGTSEIFECSNSLDFKDLSLLTAPITKEKCENKKSILNRLFTFDGTKIISGNLGPDSYFDIYIEINNEDKDKDINISPIMERELQMTNTAKYLKKDVEYKLNFKADHLIKLEPGYDATITITNGQATTTLSSKYPTATISGEGFTIKSDNDAMVYFLGKLPEVITQIKIKNEKGKIVKISNIPDVNLLLIDFGFEGYYPSAAPIQNRIRDEKIIYLDNWYEKLQTKLVNNEYLYIYILSAGKEVNLKIEYLYQNLNNINNEFNIFLVPKNDGENQEQSALVIDTSEIKQERIDVNFCKQNTQAELEFYGKNGSISLNLTEEIDEDKYGLKILEMFRGDNLLKIKTNQPLVLSYSPFDYVDEELYRNNDWIEERKVVDYPSIIAIEEKDKNNNIINIKFQPNYKYSSTRYIIIIASDSKEHRENFNDTCYIAGLLNKRPKDVIVDKTYSIGDQDTINFEVDISKIVTENNKYLINIMSQELRYKKKINLYRAKEFNFNGEIPEPDTTDTPTDTPSEDEEYEKIELGSTVEFNKYHNKFRFDYSGNNTMTAYFIFKSIKVLFYYIDENENKYNVNYESTSRGYIDYVYPINLTYNGKYYIEIESQIGPDFDIGSKFTSFLPGKVIETIDLSKSFYNSDIEFVVNQYHGPGIYKIKPLEDKLVFFASSISFYDNSKVDPTPIPTPTDRPYPYDTDIEPHNNTNNKLYSYDPRDTDEPVPEPFSDEPYSNETDKDDHSTDGPEPTDDFKTDEEQEPDKDEESSRSAYKTGYDISWANETIFKICDKDNKCEPNVRYYNFKKENEYTIYINFIKLSDTHWDYQKGEFIHDNIYQYLKFFFIPLSNNNIIRVKEEDEGFYKTGEPKLYEIGPNLKKNINIWSDLVGFRYYTQSDKQLTDISNIKNLQFKKANTLHEISKGNDKYIIIFAFSLNYESPLIFANENEQQLNKTIISADTSKYFERFELDRTTCIEHYNYMPVYTSKNKNMMYAISEKDEKTDLIFQNYIAFPIFLEKVNEEYELKVKTYKPKYAFFGATDPYFFKSAFSYLKLLTTSVDINPDNYRQLTPMNLRINSKYLPWYEFYNFYLKDLALGLNVYIKQLFGTSEIYECNADSLDFNDLTILTRPISNVNCKNKKSIFNRLFKFDGTKILSGYIGPDSYFDIYAEFENDNKNIDISPIMKNNLYMNNAAKYLRKNVEYKLNFVADHLVKLEPGFKGEITITNGQTTILLNSEHLTASISGKGYRIKSNKNAMVYFIGKLAYGFSQIKINKETGKSIKISNIPYNNPLIIDFGFEGYYPSALIMLQTRIGENGIIFIDNWYDKLKSTLVDGEELFIYYAGTEVNLKIEYLDNNLNNANNEFNIFLVPKNDGQNQAENALVIETEEISQGYVDVHFCEKDTNVKLSMEGINTGKKSYDFNDNDYKGEGPFSISRGSNKISFITDKDFVFTYSPYDMTDEEFIEKRWILERQNLTDLIITEAKSKNDEDNMITIKFKPNYINSSTRYIILVASKDSQNTLDTFKNPCYIVDLLNRRPKGVLVDKIYSIGDEGIINAEIDISSILTENNHYIVNIISQELRFEKKINFYTPKEFEHQGKEIPPTEDTDEDIESDIRTDYSDIKTDKSSDKDNTTLALAIAIPIAAVIIIAVGLFLYLRFKRKNAINSKEEIEKLVDTEKGDNKLLTSAV